jgi:putative ABC transport system permease protein
VRLLRRVLHTWPDYDGLLLGLGAGGVLLGALAAAPVVSTTALRVLAVPAVVLLRPIGRLARGNVVRYPRRTANTAGALMIGMALVGLSATLAASTTASTAELLEEEVNADLVLASGSFPMPPVFLEEVSAVPGVERVDLVSMGLVDVDGTMKFLSGQPVEMFNSSIRAVVTAGSLAELGPGTIALEEGQAGKRTVGDTITVVADAGPIELEVVALVKYQVNSGIWLRHRRD